MTEYFSDREQGARARTIDVIPLQVWRGLLVLIQNRIKDGSLGLGFPEMCPDGGAISGTDESAFWNLARAEIPDLCVLKDAKNHPWKTDPVEHWPPSQEIAPDTLAILDFLEFVARNIGQPMKDGYHSYFRHDHLVFDRDAGLRSFLSDANRVLQRSSIAFELNENGLIRRTLPATIDKTLHQLEFRTGDSVTDNLIARSIELFASPKPTDAQDAIEKLWDAFERVKTLEEGNDKKEKSATLLAKAGSGIGSYFNESIERDFKELTTIGNNMRIRHSETNKETIQSREQAEYLFVRMFVALRYVLLRTGRIVNS